MTTTYTAGERILAANMPGPYLLSAMASADTSVATTTLTDLTGASITFTTKTANATIEVDGTFDMQVGATGTAIATGHCIVDGVDQTSQATSSLTTAGQRTTSGQTWVVTIATPGTHTVKLQGALSANSGTCSFRSTHTTIRMLVLDF